MTKGFSGSSLTLDFASVAINGLVKEILVVKSDSMTAIMICSLSMSRSMTVAILHTSSFGGLLVGGWIGSRGYLMQDIARNERLDTHYIPLV